MVDLVKGRRTVSIRAPLSADKSPFRGAIVRGLRAHAEIPRLRSLSLSLTLARAQRTRLSIVRFRVFNCTGEPVEGCHDGYSGTFYEIIGRD